MIPSWVLWLTIWHGFRLQGKGAAAFVLVRFGIVVGGVGGWGFKHGSCKKLYKTPHPAPILLHLWLPISTSVNKPI